MTPFASRASSIVDVSTDPRSNVRGSFATFATFAVRVIVAHTVTYTMAGILASTLLDYRTWWASEFMSQYRPFDSAWIAAGPALQVLRGVVLAAVLFPFRHVFLEKPRGWLPLAALLIGVGILSTYAAAPGSIEGVIYTRLPLAFHTFGLPEVVTQATVFSALLVAWYRHPRRAWSVVLGFLMALCVAASVAGVVLGPQS
jgi:hypothetical protein